jgi:hypothetical protein
MRKILIVGLTFIALTTTFVSKAMAPAAVPGFNGTVNNYGVGMNDKPECRHPPAGQQPACSGWFRFRFQADNDGTVHAPFRISNDSINGYCGAVKFVVRDRANPPGNILGTFRRALTAQMGKVLISTGMKGR